MNKSGPASGRDKSGANLSPEELNEVLHRLGEQLAHREHIPDDRGEMSYLDLPPKVRRWLAWLGQDENAKVFDFFRSLDEEKVKDFDQMLHDYKSAQSFGKFVKMFWVIAAGLVTVTVGVVKGLPDFLDGLRRFLLK